MSKSDLVEVLAVGVCASDRQRLPAGFDLRSVGHEVVGRGRDGQMVAIRTLNPCGACPACRRAGPSSAPNDPSIGRLNIRHGGSGLVTAVPRQLCPLPAELPVSVATLADPLACVLEALHGVAMRGTNALVIDDRPMAALAAVYTGQIAGARVTVAVKDHSRIARMLSFADCVATGTRCPWATTMSFWS